MLLSVKRAVCSFRVPTMSMTFRYNENKPSPSPSVKSCVNMYNYLHRLVNVDFLFKKKSHKFSLCCKF